MSEKQEPDGLERLAHLEDKIYRVSEFFKNLQAENLKLKEELSDFQRRYRDLDERYRAIEQMMIAVRDEKEKIAEKIRVLLEYLERMENKQ
jgi:FtsZ-binding cell division protein ZapB